MTKRKRAFGKIKSHTIRNKGIFSLDAGFGKY